MKEWEGRIPAMRPSRVPDPEDDARLRPLALVRAARMEGRAVCFVCDGPLGYEDERGRLTLIHPPVIAVLDVGLEIRPPVCRHHADIGSWPGADWELVSWMARNGWGKPMDPAMLGDAQ